MTSLMNCVHDGVGFVAGRTWQDTSRQFAPMYVG